MAPAASSKLAKLAGNMKTSLRPEVAGGVDLLGPPPSPAGPDRFAGTARAKDVLVIPTANIVADPDQPRTEFDPEALERLAASLRSHGLLQPIRVRWDESSGKYIVIAGERRWRAAQLAGLATMTATVAEPEPARILEQQLIENALRVDLNPIEQAHAYRRLMDDRGWSQSELAERLSIHRGTVSRALSLLDLPASIQEKVEGGAITRAAAEVIARVEDPVEQEVMAIQAAEVGLTHKQLRADKASRAPAAPKSEAKAGARTEAKPKAAPPAEKAPKPRPVEIQRFHAELPGGEVWIQFKDVDGIGLAALLDQVRAMLEQGDD